jgi:hypothetical protein
MNFYPFNQSLDHPDRRWDTDHNIPDWLSIPRRDD